MTPTTETAALTFDEARECLGRVQSVDTATVVLKVDDLQTLQRMQVNRLVAIRMNAAGNFLIGVVDRIRRMSSMGEIEEDEAGVEAVEQNVVRVVLIGTFKALTGDGRRNRFVRSLEQVASIDAAAFALEGERLTFFMRCISQETDPNTRLKLGVYTLDETAEAYLDGNRFFQRHAVIVGSTGSGKSWTTARLLEAIAALPNGNAIVIDIHGEYAALAEDPGVAVYRVAGPQDVADGLGIADGVLHFPYWLFAYEALRALLVERSGEVAVVQASLFSRAVRDAKQATLQTEGDADLEAQFTLDSPIPFDLEAVLTDLREKDDKVPGQKDGSLIKGDYTGKLTKLIERIVAKRADRRYGFMFGAPGSTLDLAWLEQLAKTLITNEPLAAGAASRQVRVIDFSEVPSDILPLMVGCVADLVLRLKQWGRDGIPDPVSLFCDEAHLYIPQPSAAMDELSASSLEAFERIAKEGRKYGVGLVVVSQRPSEVNRTVLSQSSNYIAMRLLNVEDRAVIRALLPDSLGGFSDLLQVLDEGEALVVGDASLLPSRVRIEPPVRRPNSGTVPFWTKWGSGAADARIAESVRAWRKQSIAR
jgi:hypothetical protein